MDLVPKKGRPLERRSLADRKALARTVNPIIDEARVTALKMNGAVAVGEHAMVRLSEMEDYRRDLVGMNEVKNSILSQIEMNTVRQVSKLQNRLYDDFGLGGN